MSKANGQKPTLTPAEQAAIQAADAIARGNDPAGAQGSQPFGGTLPPSEGPAGAPAPAAPPPPPEECSRLGRVAVRLTDALLGKLAGLPPMDSILASEAAAAWAAVIARYAPTLATAGPAAQVCLIYAIHIGGAWIEPENSSLPAPPDPEKPPS